MTTKALGDGSADSPRIGRRLATVPAIRASGLPSELMAARFSFTPPGNPEIGSG
jgi:hypothetical protein